MARFIVRRLIAMVGVLFAISVLTFLIFQAIPNGDPALRIGGRLANADEIAQIRARVGLRQADLRPVRQDDGADLHGTVSPTRRAFNVVDEIRQALPATLSLAIGAGIIWLSSAILFGVITAVRAGQLHRPRRSPCSR